MENHAEIVHQKLAPDPYLILLNNPKQPLHTRNSFKKALKKLTLFFLSNLVPFNGQSYQNKRGLELVTSRSSGQKTSTEKFLYSLYII